MESPSLAVPGANASALVERVRLGFFRSFSVLLLLAIAVAEWAWVAWVLHRLGVMVPFPVHVAAPAAIYLLNRRLVTRPRRADTPASPLMRLYTAVAFTSVFAGVFLALAGLARVAVPLVLLPAEVVLGVTMRLPGDLSAFFPWFVDAGLLGIAGLFALGYTHGPRKLATTRHEVAVGGLPAPLDGFRIVHLSDLHIGQYLGAEELAAHVARVNALDPDLICITGDLVDRADTCAWGFPVLAGLRARHGVMVTLGNHDHGAGAAAVTAALLRHTSFTVLRDERTAIAVAGTTLHVVGLDDLGRDWARGVSEHPAMPALVDDLPAGAPLLVLTHRPDCFPQAARLGASLVLAGHTHGGQLGLPVPGRVRNLAEFITPFHRGVYRKGAATLLVSNGLGFTGQRIRLFTPREIACLALRAA